MPAKRNRLVGVNMSEEMIEAWEAAAAGVSKSTWLRCLVGRELGIKAEMPVGQAALDEQQKAARLATYRNTIAAREKAAKKS